MHLPDAPAPSEKVSFHSCGDKDDITRMQRRHVELWTRLNGVPPPDNYEAMGYADLEKWIEAQYKIWRHGDAKEQMPLPYDLPGYEAQPQLGTKYLGDDNDDADDDGDDKDGDDDDDDEEGKPGDRDETICHIPTPDPK